MPDQEDQQLTTIRAGEPAPIVGVHSVEKSLRLAQAVQAAAIEDAAEVYQAFATLAKKGTSWRASHAFLTEFVKPILDADRAAQDGADLPQAIEDGSLAGLLTDLAERIAIQGGLDLTGDQAEADQDRAMSISQQAKQDPDDDSHTFESRLDSIRIAVIRERVTGRDPGPRQDDPRRASKDTPPHPIDAGTEGGRGRETTEVIPTRFVSKMGDNVSIEDAEFTEGGNSAREAMFRDRRRGDE